MRRRSTDGCRPVDASRRLGMPRRRSIAATIWSLMASASRSFRFGWLIQSGSYYAGVDSRADRNAGMSITGAVVGLTRTLCRSRTLTRVVAAIGLALWLHPSALTQSPEKPPARIVSLIPATTEMLFAVGVGDRVVGVGSFDRFPPEVERIQRVGALLDPDVERILALRPDLVVVYKSQADLLAQLARAQVPTFVYAHAGLADVTATLRELGARVGAGDRASTLAADIERRIDATRKRYAAGPRPKTLIVMGRDAFTLRGIYASG